VQQLERFNARPVSGASAELISDVDLSTTGVHAGEDMIKAEQYMAKRFGSGWSEMLRMNFYTEAERLTQYEKVLDQMNPAQLAELQRKLSNMSEKYNIAKMLHHAGDNPESIARVEGIAERLGFNIHAPDVQALVHLDESAMLKQRNQLLRQIDGLAAEYETATGPRKVELAQEISMKQVEANFYTTEAYIGPGAGPMTVRGIPVKGEEAFQAAMSDMEMFEHVMGQAAGDPVIAAREYELYKYTNRFVKAARSAGVTHPGMDYFEHMSEYLYRVDREANTTTGHMWKDPKVLAPPKVSVWVTDLPQDVGGFTPVNETYLRTYVQEFRQFALDVLPEIRRLARENPAAAAATP
jgi:hypothetical protein